MSRHSIDIIQQILRSNGYSFTASRRLMIQLLLDHDAQSLADITRQVDGRINRSSIYRTVQLFEKLGLVQRVRLGWKYQLELTDIVSNHHHHISCSRCGRITTIEEDGTIESLIENLANQYGYSPAQHQLEIQGICSSCQAL